MTCKSNSKSNLNSPVPPSSSSSTASSFSSTSTSKTKKSSSSQAPTAKVLYSIPSVLLALQLLATTSTTNASIIPTSHSFSSFTYFNETISLICDHSIKRNSSTSSSTPNNPETPDDPYCLHHLIAHPMDPTDSQDRLVSVGLVKVGVTYIILYSTLATLLFGMAALVLLRHGFNTRKRWLPQAWALGFSLVLGLIGSGEYMRIEVQVIGRAGMEVWRVKWW